MNPRCCQTENDSSVKAFPQSIGTTTSPATNVTVNTSNEVIYADVTFASTNQPWVNGNNTFTAIAKDAYGRRDTNSITVLQATNVYAYDLNGNLLYDGRRAFAYDDENQLIRVTVTNGWKSEFTYDGKLRRRIVKEFTWNGSWMQTNEVHYIYDGNLVVQERDANNLPLVTYVRGTDLSGSFQGAGGIGGLLARTDNSKLLISDSFATSFYHADGNGNVTCLTYPNGTIAAKYLYDPYGNMLSMYGSLADANTYHFSSKEWNANSGLYYYLYRLYDPNTQRWLNRDPIKERGGLNLYQFVRNQTISLVDKSGLNFWEDPYSPIYPNNPPFPTPPPNPALDKARDWLKKCHSELCPGGANVLNLPIGYLPGGGEEGSSILPGIIIIDFPSMKGDPSNFVRTLAHECMHKRDGFLHGEWDYWFNGDADHTQIFNDADKIQREYDSDPEGKKCDKCKK